MRQQAERLGNEEEYFCRTAWSGEKELTSDGRIKLQLKAGTVWLTTKEWHLYRACSGFHTLEEHAANLLARGIKNSSNEAYAALKDLRTLGLLLPCGSAVPLAQNSDSPTHIKALAVNTADRPAACMDAVQSYCRNLDNFNKTASILILDDSRQETRLIERLSVFKNHQREIRYCGRREKAEFAEALAEQGLAPEVSRFALLGDDQLFPCSIGANRNALLLESAEEAVLSVDDDTVCQLRAHPAPLVGLQLFGHSNPRDHWFFDSRSAALSGTKAIEVDLLTEHESLLGRTAAEIIHQFGFGSTKAENISNDFEYQLQNCAARVQITLGGVVGDSGATNTQWIWDLNQRDWSRICQQGKNAFQSREIQGVTQMRSLAHSSFFVATTVGYAAPSALPPFMPVGRNEDGVFGSLFHRSSPESLIGHLPVAVTHNAFPGRVYRDFAIRYADLLLALIAQFKFDQSKALTFNLKALGQYFIQISANAENDFIDYIEPFIHQRIRSRIHHIEHKLLQNHSVSCNVIDTEAKVQLQKLQGLLLSTPFASSNEDNIGQANIKRLLNLTGRVFADWDAIKEAASYLKTKGLRLSRRLV